MAILLSFCRPAPTGGLQQGIIFQKTPYRHSINHKQNQHKTQRCRKLIQRGSKQHYKSNRQRHNKRAAQREIQPLVLTFTSVQNQHYQNNQHKNNGRTDTCNHVSVVQKRAHSQGDKTAYRHKNNTNHRPDVNPPVIPKKMSIEEKNQVQAKRKREK